MDKKPTYEELEQRIQEFGEQTTKHKQMEEEMRESKAFSSSLLNNSPHPILVINPDTSIRYVNPELETLTGFSSEELTGRKAPYLWWTEETIQKTGKDLEEAMRKGARRLEELFQKKNGERFWVDITSVPIRENGEFKYYLANWVDITERKEMEESIKHLNLVLRAIRNVNQLITREKDRNKLIQGICDILIETRGYHNAWIALFDEHERLVTTAEAGLGNDFLPMIDNLKSGKITDCGRKAFVQSEVIAIEDPASTCADCPLSAMYSGKGAMTIRLEHEGRVYGLLSASIPRNYITNKEEHSLFQEVSGDIAYALYNIELEDERRKAEEALRETRDYLEKLINHANAPIIVWSPDFRIIRFNHAFEHLTGYSADNVIGQKLHMLFPEASRKESISRIKSTLAGEYWESVEIPIFCKDEDIRIALWNSANIYAEDGKTVIATIAQGQDITERKSVEEALRESEEKMCTILDSMPDVVLQLDTNLEILWANKATIKLNPHAVGQLCYKALPGRNDLCPGCPIVKALKTGQIERGIVYLQSVTGVGESYWDDIGVPIKDARGKITSIVKLARNIKKNKKKEKERKKLQSQLQQAQKMEAIGTLVGGIAHDFNNILFPMMGFAEMMLDDLPSDSPHRKHTYVILHGAKRARDLVKQILTFSRQSGQELKPLKVQLIIKEVLKLIRSSLPSTIEIKQYVSNKCGLVMADFTQIHQIAMNLMTNAYQAMEDEGGELEVTLKEVELGVDDLTDPSMTPGAYVCLTVADTGPGMDQSVISRIFEPYFTTKENGKGTGLGLAVVHGIVKSFNGDIKVYSEPGKGTAFHVYLPVIKIQVETEAEVVSW